MHHPKCDFCGSPTHPGHIVHLSGGQCACRRCTENSLREGYRLLEIAGRTYEEFTGIESAGSVGPCRRCRGHREFGDDYDPDGRGPLCKRCMSRELDRLRHELRIDDIATHASRDQSAVLAFLNTLP